MRDSLDDAAVHRWCGGGLAALRAHQREIDDLNVYPVPDGDTGTNLVLTLASAQQALDELLRQSGGRPAAPGSSRSSSAEPSAGPSSAGFSLSSSPGHPPSGAGRAVLSGEVLAGEQTPLARAMRRMARGALLGARGNSGVIVSQILRGMAEEFAGAVAVRGGELARALRSATEAAYAAVARPVEGTVLSVVAAAADAAARVRSDDLLAVARAASRAAAEALARTPQQLPVLARAGVVDAGGRGLCLLLDALVDALSADGAATAPTRPAAGAAAGAFAAEAGGERAADGPAVRNHTAEGSTADGRVEPPADNRLRLPANGPLGPAADGFAEAGAAGAGHGAHAAPPGGEPIGPADYGHEVQYLLDADAPAVDRLKERLAALGDSLVVVGSGDGTWNVHVHVPIAHIGAAVEAGVEAGRPHRITVTPLVEHVHPAPAVDPDARGAVVVAAGDGLTALFAAEGAVVVGRNPSTAEVLDAIAATRAGRVVLLPNDANTHAVATSAAREAQASGVRVSVVPTRSPVQALAALAVRDPHRRFADDVIAMAEAAGACRYGEVCTAQREALTVAGRCRPGELLGLVDGEVHIIGGDLTEVSRRLLDRMLGGGGELATLILGADAPPTLEQALRDHMAQTWPFVELQCWTGGQPRYHLLVGVE